MLQNQDTIGNVQDVVHRLKSNYKSCRGDYQRMFYPLVDMYKVETIHDMFDEPILLPTFINLIDSISGLTTIMQQIPNLSIADQADKVNYLLAIKEDLSAGGEHINGIVDIVLYAEKFQRYRQARKVLKNVAEMLALWIEFTSETSSYHDFVDMCLSNDLVDWFDDLQLYINWMATFIVEQKIFSRADVTRLAAQFKADMCQAALLLSACETAKNSSKQLKSIRFIVVSERLLMLAKQFGDIDKAIVTSARADLIRDTTNAIKTMQNLTDDTRAIQIYNVLAPKYYWLNLNVVLYQSDNTVWQSYFPIYFTEIECVVYTKDTYAPATSFEWQGLVYAWRKSLDPKTVTHVARQSLYARDRMISFFHNSDKSPFGFLCNLDNCDCFNATIVHDAIWQGLENSNDGTHPSFVFSAYVNRRLFSSKPSGYRPLQHGNTVGTQLPNNAYMVWSHEEECGYARPYSKIVFFLGSYCPDKPFTTYP